MSRCLHLFLISLTSLALAGCDTDARDASKGSDAVGDAASRPDAADGQDAESGSERDGPASDTDAAETSPDPPEDRTPNASSAAAGDTEGSTGASDTDTSADLAPSVAGDSSANDVADQAGSAAGDSSSGAEDGGSVGRDPSLDVSLEQVLDPARATRWAPGIQRDELLGLPLAADGLPVRETRCATLSPGDDIQAAIDACAPGEVVELSTGTFTLDETLTLRDGVVLRGQGSEGAPSGTTLVKQGGQTVVAIGTARDQVCYGGDGFPLLEDAAKESTTLVVGDAAARFSAGDLALVDIVDPPEVQQGDCLYFKREEGRSVSQRVEIAEVDEASGTLTLSSPLHWSFRTSDQAEVTPVGERPTRWAGVEHLLVQGGSNPGYNGEMAGGIDISNAAYCWVKDVQTDETIGGMHVSLTATYRSVVRDGNFHHSADYGFGADCYGIVLRCGAAENLIENNIVRYMNKPIMFNVTGGGNVVGYNYADNSWATPPEWQEVNIDCHCSFPHMELMEGNYAPHMGATTTHGNAGYLSYFRNCASSQFAAPAVVGSSAEQTGNVTALQFDGGDVGMNVIGNVLGSAGVSETYEAYDSGPISIYELGANGDGSDDVAATSLYRHGNFDFVNDETQWVDEMSRELPASFYYSSQPAWWPDDMSWPWVGPDLEPMVLELPAKARSDALQ